MGNATAKLKQTELGVGSLHKDEGSYIAKAFVSIKDGTTKIKNKGKTWVTADDDDGDAPPALLWKTRSVGMIYSHSVIEDSAGTHVATIITEKKGMASSLNWVCRSVPTFEGQSPLTEEELRLSGVATKKDPESFETLLYGFSKIECSRKMTTARCSYGIVTGPDRHTDIQPLYEGEKISSLGFKAIFREVTGDTTSTGEDGIVVAKAYMQGLSMSPRVDAAIGVDMLAIVSMGYSLAGEASSAGALAGAGVI